LISQHDFLTLSLIQTPPPFGVRYHFIFRYRDVWPNLDISAKFQKPRVIKMLISIGSKI